MEVLVEEREAERKGQLLARENFNLPKKYSPSDGPDCIFRTSGVTTCTAPITDIRWEK